MVIYYLYIILRMILRSDYSNILHIEFFAIFFSIFCQKTSRVWEFFLGLVDPSRNRLVSTAFQNNLLIFACMGTEGSK